MESILDSIKDMLGIRSDYTYFDDTIIADINSVFSVLTQLGVGPTTGFYIRDGTTVWNEYLSDDSRLEFIKTYIYLRVRLMFDPPQTGPLIESINRQIEELQFRINVAVDPNINV